MAQLIENEDFLASCFRRTGDELNNISISLLYFGNHQIALETLVDAIRILKYNTFEGGNEAEYQNDADESVRRAVAAVRREYGQLAGESSNIHLSYGSRRLNDVDLNETDIFHRTKEEFGILLFNVALIHQNHGISNSTHASLQISLMFYELVLDLFGVKISGKGTFAETQCTSLMKLNLLTDTLSSMGRIYSHLRQYSFAEACFSRASRIPACSILDAHFSAAAA